MAWVLGYGCEAIGLPGVRAGVPMAWMLRSVGLRDLEPKSTWLVVPAWNWNPTGRVLQGHWAGIQVAL